MQRRRVRISIVTYITVRTSARYFMNSYEIGCALLHKVDKTSSDTYAWATARTEFGGYAGKLISSIFPLRESELSSDQLTGIAVICSDTVVVEGTLLFSQGTRANRLYIVTEGLIALQMATRVPHATESRRTTVAICGRGEVVGWSAMVHPFRYALSAMAWEQCRLIAIDSHLLRRALTANQAAGFCVMQSLSEVMSRRIRQITMALVSERETTAARRQTTMGQ